MRIEIDPMTRRGELAANHNLQNEEALKKVAGENRNQLEERKRLEDSHALLRRAMEKANQYCLSIGVQDMGL